MKEDLTKDRFLDSRRVVAAQVPILRNDSGNSPDKPHEVPRSRDPPALHGRQVGLWKKDHHSKDPPPKVDAPLDTAAAPADLPPPRAAHTTAFDEEEPDSSLSVDSISYTGAWERQRARRELAVESVRQAQLPVARLAEASEVRRSSDGESYLHVDTLSQSNVLSAGMENASSYTDRHSEGQALAPSLPEPGTSTHIASVLSFREASELDQFRSDVHQAARVHPLPPNATDAPTRRHKSTGAYELSHYREPSAAGAPKGGPSFARSQSANVASHTTPRPDFIERERRIVETRNQILGYTPVAPLLSSSLKPGQGEPVVQSRDMGSISEQLGEEDENEEDVETNAQRQSWRPPSAPPPSTPPPQNEQESPRKCLSGGLSKRSLWIGVCVVIVLIVVIIAVSVGSQSQNDDGMSTSSTTQPIGDRLELISVVDRILTRDAVEIESVESLYGPIEQFDVSGITDFSSVFDAVGRNAAAALFSADLSAWNTSSATTMSRMFQGAAAFNGTIGSWQVGLVRSARHMFAGALVFNQPLGSWDVSSLRIAQSMFEGAVAFNQSLQDWNMTSVTSIDSMFRGATSFSQDLCRWADDLSEGTAVNDAFGGSGCPRVSSPVLNENGVSSPVLNENGPFCFSCP